MHTLLVVTVTSALWEPKNLSLLTAVQKPSQKRRVAVSKNDRFEIAFFQGIIPPPAVAVEMYRDANEKLSPGIILYISLV